MASGRAARREGWERELAAVVERARDRPFRWGMHDCVTFAADAVAALTGADPLGDLRGTWRDGRGALRLMNEIAPSLEALVTKVLGPACAPALARRGDVLVVAAGKRAALGVCLGHSAAMPGPAGLAFAPMSLWRAAYPVGWSD